MFLLNSRLGLFSAIRRAFTCERLLTLRTPLIPKLRGQFAEFLKKDYLAALVFSTYLPVSVCGTGSTFLTRSFSRQCRITQFAVNRCASRLCVVWWICLPYRSHACPGNHHPVELPSCVTPSLKQNILGSEYEPIIHRLRLSPSA